MSEDVTLSEEKPAEKKLELNLLIWPDPFLRYAAAPFTEEQIKAQLAKDVVAAMFEAMYKHNGVGLAAEQIGVPQQVFVMDATWQQPGNVKTPRVFFNPTIISEEGGAVEVDYPGEGCLSTPYDFRRPVPRAKRIEVEWLDENAEFHCEWFEGFESIIIQHECDHLYGMLFVDRLSRLKQDMFKRRARKVRRMIEKQYKRQLSTLKWAGRTPWFNLERAKQWEIDRRKKLEDQEANLHREDPDVCAVREHGEESNALTFREESGDLHLPSMPGE